MSEFYMIGIDDDGNAHISDHFGYPAEIAEADALIAICRKYIEQNSPQDIEQKRRDFIAKVAPNMYEQMFREPLPMAYRREPADTLPKPKPKAIPGYIYLFHGRETDWYKIGKATTPQARFKQLGTQGPFALDLIYSFAVDDMNGVEKLLHDYYAHLRCQGEWFTLSEADVERFSHLTGRTVEQVLRELRV